MLAVAGSFAGDQLDKLLPGVLGNWLFALAIAGIPASAGIAILRHRLYDIDRIVNRTIVYRVLTAGLVGTYLAGVVATRTGGRPSSAAEADRAMDCWQW